MRLKNDQEESPWYNNVEMLKKCGITAKHLMKCYPSARFVSLGQSPAWIVHTINVIKSENNSNYDSYYIPFSGRFYESATGMLSNDSTTPKKAYRQTVNTRPEHELSYRNILAQLDFTPKTIIERAQQGQPTVLLEYTQSGEGLASFISVIYRWARELGAEDVLHKALSVCILVQDFNALKVISIPEENITVVADRLQVDTDMIVAIANGVDDGPLAERLVAHYPFWRWDKPPSLSKAHHNNIQHIADNLRVHIPRQIASPPKFNTESNRKNVAFEAKRSQLKLKFFNQRPKKNASTINPRLSGRCKPSTDKLLDFDDFNRGGSASSLITA